MTQLLTLILLAGPSAPDSCKPIYAGYRLRLTAATKSRPAYRKLRLESLAKLERLFKQCFTSKEGRELRRLRLRIAAGRPTTFPWTNKPRPASRPVPPSDRRATADQAPHFSTASPRRPPTRAQRPRARVRRPTPGVPSLQPAAGWKIKPASAALFSLAIPGAGQALQNRTGPAWLFFILAHGGYAGGAIATASTSGSKKPNYTVAVALFVAGGIAHLISVIDAGAQ